MSDELPPTWWKERFNSCKLSSDIRISAPLCILEHMHVSTHAINVK